MNIKQTFLNQDKTIYSVENVLSDENYLIVKDFCSKETGWFNYEDRVKTLFYVKQLRPRVFSIMQDMLDNILKTLEPELTSSMTMPFLKHSAENTTTQQSVAWSILPHLSNGNKANNFKKGFTFFINEDYDGGDFIFLNDNIQYKPKANSMLVHLASDLHGSKEILNGYAYTFTEYLFNK